MIAPRASPRACVLEDHLTSALTAALRARLTPYFFFDLRARDPPLDRSRSIWARGSVTQISPIQSSFTPLIALALKLVRLTVDGWWDDVLRALNH